MNDIRERAYIRWLEREHPLQKPLNEYLAQRYRFSPPLTRTSEQNRKVVEIIIAKVLFERN